MRSVSQKIQLYKNLIHTTPQSPNLFWLEAMGLSCQEGSEIERFLEPDV